MHLSKKEIHLKLWEFLLEHASDGHSVSTHEVTAAINAPNVVVEDILTDFERANYLTWTINKAEENIPVWSLTAAGQQFARQALAQMTSLPEGFTPLSPLEVKVLEAASQETRRLEPVRQPKDLVSDAEAALKGIAEAQKFLRKHKLPQGQPAVAPVGHALSYSCGGVEIDGVVISNGYLNETVLLLGTGSAPYLGIGNPYQVAGIQTLADLRPHLGSAPSAQQLGWTTLSWTNPSLQDALRLRRLKALLDKRLLVLPNSLLLLTATSALMWSGWQNYLAGGELLRLIWALFLFVALCFGAAAAGVFLSEWLTNQIQKRLEQSVHALFAPLGDPHDRPLTHPS